MNFRLWSITFQLMELKVFSASISKIPSMLSSLKTSYISCIAASDPATCPSHSCSDPAAWSTSFFNRIITAFPEILLSTFPTPIGLSPDRLSNGINLHAMNDSRDYAFFISSKQSLLTNSGNVLGKSDDAVPNERDVRIFLQPSASRPDGSKPPFYRIAAFKMRAHPYLHIQLGEQVLSVLGIILLGAVH